jgi:hypothetical protein
MRRRYRNRFRYRQVFSIPDFDRNPDADSDSVADFQRRRRGAAKPLSGLVPRSSHKIMYSSGLKSRHVHWLDAHAHARDTP